MFLHINLIIYITFKKYFTVYLKTCKKKKTREKQSLLFFFVFDITYSIYQDESNIIFLNKYS